MKLGAVLMTVALLLAAGSGWILWRTQPERLRTDLSTLLSDRTGRDVQINGPIEWRWFPHANLRIADLAANGGRDTHQADELSLVVGWLSLVRPVSRWRIESFRVSGFERRTQEATLTVSHLTVHDYAPEALTPFDAQLEFHPVATDLIHTLHATGRFRFTPEPWALEIATTRLRGNTANGLCDARVSDNGRTADAVDPAPATLRPVVSARTWQTRNWTLACDFESIVYAGHDFNSVRVHSTNQSGNAAATLTLDDWAGGSVDIDISADATTTPLRWQFEPQARQLDGAQLDALLTLDAGWQGQLDFAGSFSATGNTEPAIADSLTGTLQFDAGQGQLNISRIKRAINEAGAGFGADDTADDWPDVLDYKRLLGTWRADAGTHRLDVTLDNMRLLAPGTYDAAEDRLRLKPTLTFQATEDAGLPVDPLLTDLPLPFRCSGQLRKPACSLDTRAAKRLVGDVLTGKQDGALRDKIEKTIEEDVPEAYQDAARDLLEWLGDALGGGQP